MPTTPAVPHGPISWPAADGHTIEVFPGGPGRDGKPRWYWHLKYSNGQIGPDGGQGFHRRRSAIRSAKRAFPESS